MEDQIRVKPLPYKRRRTTFGLLFLIFIIAIPFLYLYATGYRFAFQAGTNIVSTGGLYIGADRVGVSIYVDDELVSDTRVFLRAYYIQGLEPKTHRVTVQKEDHHTWVKELPVYPHLVTQAEAFNMPLQPVVRVISPWQTATGETVVFKEIFTASTTNGVFLSTTTRPERIFETDREFELLFEMFSTSTPTSTAPLAERVVEQIRAVSESTTTATTTEVMATTTKEWKDVRLYEDGDNFFAKWIGTREGMPYYYCAEEFSPYSTTTTTSTTTIQEYSDEANNFQANVSAPEFIHPVKTISNEVECDPTIQIHTQFQKVRSFDFFPGSADLIVFALENGVYVIEIDNRAWQNIQPLVEGENLDMRVENGQIYVYDGDLIYQIILED